MTYSPHVAPSRSRSIKRGRPKVSAGTPFWWHGGYSPETANAAWQPTAADRDCYVPYLIPHPLLVNQVGVQVTSIGGAGTFLRVGMYAADRNLQPLGAPIFDSGNIAQDSTGLKTYTPGAAIFLPRGRYLAVVNCQATVPSLAVAQGAGGYPHTVSTWDSTYTTYVNYFVATRSYAAFPTPGTAWTAVNRASTFSWRAFLGLGVVGS